MAFSSDLSTRLRVRMVASCPRGLGSLWHPRTHSNTTDFLIHGLLSQTVIRNRRRNERHGPVWQEGIQVSG